MASQPQRGLTNHETLWRDRYDWLLQSGYKLRPRYKPDWSPSWVATNITLPESEDSVVQMISHKIMDAVRVSDNAMVVLKRVPQFYHPNEIPIHQFLCSELLLSDPRNHTCPILDTLEDPLDSNIRIIVEPLLRFYNEPKCLTIGEALECFRQAIEGLQFMHAQHVAHRDVMRMNFMMDPHPIYPEMFHPVEPWMTRDYTKMVKARWTRTARPVKYYYIDYGLSRRYNPEETNPLEVPIFGGDRSVPEFQLDRTIPRNPFHTDVYYLGNFIREDFLNVYSNLSFLKPLIADMVQDIPDKRPTMDVVGTRFTKIISKLSWVQLRARLLKKEDDFGTSAVKISYHVCVRTLPDLLKRRAALPCPASDV